MLTRMEDSIEHAAKLSALLAGQVLTDSTQRATFARDTSLFEVTPALVVQPQHVADIKNLVQYVANLPASKRPSLTVRSGGTDMTGGPLTDSIVVDVQKHLTHIGEITENTITTQPGAFYRDFEAKTLAAGLLMPSYPASRDICTIGGMVANNAGGEKTLTYGKVADYVTQLKIILHDGEEYTIKPLTKRELETVISEQSLLGQLYQQLLALITTHADLLRAARPHVSKNSSGYALWDIWDGQTFNPTRLFTGSQGTLGIITEITLKLIKPSPHRRMVVVFLKDLTRLADMVTTVLRYQPETFESYDRHTLKVALKLLPALVKQMKTTHLLQLGVSLLPELKLLLTGGLPRLVLLAEFSGHNEAEVIARARAARAALRPFNVMSRLTRNQTEMDKYWTIRRQSFNLLRQHVHGLRTAPFIDDIAVHPASLSAFLPELETIMSHYNLLYTIAGHVGDGNFHIIPLIDPTRPDLTHVLEELSTQVFDLVLRFRGSMSGEHNDGLVRSHYVKRMFGPAVYDLFVQTKTLFDPQGIFNPRKKVGADWAWAKQHLRHDAA